MRVLSLLGRTGLRSPRLLGSTPRALPILAVRQHLLSAHKALPPALAVPTIKHEQPNLHVLQLVAAGSVLGVLAQSYEPASCGKRKKKDTNQDDDMYELDHIKARKYQDMVHVQVHASTINTVQGCTTRSGGHLQQCSQPVAWTPVPGW